MPYVARKYMDRERLGPPPQPSSLAVSTSMRSNRRQDTGPELLLAFEFERLQAPPFVRNDPSLSGSPDFAFHGPQVAVFVYGCFWHRCPWCKPRLPMAHRDFWRRKFERNRRRDRRKREALRRTGWHVLAVWECRLKRDPPVTAGKILRRIDGLRKSSRGMAR